MRRVSPIWILLFLLTWWFLSWPRTDAWVAGALAVLVGALLHTRLGGRSEARVRVRGLLAFVPYFLWQSVRGGLDVGRRALHPALPLDPDFLRYRVRLPHGPARVLFTNAISLLPGTFSADLRDGELIVHRLTADVAGEERLRLLEEKVATLFGVPLAGDGGTLPVGGARGSRRVP